MVSYEHSSTINQTTDVVFNFLQDLNNASELIPQTLVRNWQSTQDTCSFEFMLLMNSLQFSMQVVERTPNTKIVLNSLENSFAICSIIANLQSVGNQTVVEFKFETPDETFSGDCPYKLAVQLLLQLLSTNLKSKFK